MAHENCGDVKSPTATLRLALPEKGTREDGSEGPKSPPLSSVSSTKLGVNP